MNWKKTVLVLLRYYSKIRLEGSRKITKHLSQDSRSPGRDLKTEPSEYEAVVLTARPQRLVENLISSVCSLTLLLYMYLYSVTSHPLHFSSLRVRHSL
jgi:hypothetical protein